ncbi:hypothetical protein [Paenibacillus sp. 2TAB19]|uniref:hypothetical protein n=1 Tax=Paenibacillus sp. 2TAB19 TaxID=3233003 RepID=UPI003F96CBE3
MSRRSRSGSSSRQEHYQLEGTAEPSASSLESTDVSALPPRRKKHPSSAQKVTKWYYNLIVVLFLGLVAGLFYYGIKYTQ